MANDAVVIDLMNMTAVRVDPDKKLAFIQAGADGGDVDHETALHNLICITGSVSHTGFAGVALGGGIGHLSRWLGPVVDSIVGYEMVTAKGEIIRVDAETDPELFWGMRGNGASFGIVTEFVLKLRDMPNDGIIRSAPILWPDTKAPEVMSSWMKRIARPDRKDTETLQFAFLHSPDGDPMCGVVPLIVGETEEAARAPATKSRRTLAEPWYGKTRKCRTLPSRPRSTIAIRTTGTTGTKASSSTGIRTMRMRSRRSSTRLSRPGQISRPLR
jgi:hypothetical protein